MVDKKTGKKEQINPRDFLSEKQRPKVFTHPDMTLQFVHYLEKKWCEEQDKEVAIYAEIKAKLNQRKYQQYIDNTVDLTQEKWSFFKESTWISPFEEEE